MPYHCVVCVKQVPDTKNVTGDAMKEDGTVNRAALPAVFNPEDLNALETALQIRDQHGGSVTAVTMGLPKACDVLREAIFRGAAGSDTLATSYILSCAVRKLDPDIVLCGRQAIDGDTAQVGPQLAEKLNVTLITYLEALEALENGTITIRRNVGNGHETVRAPLPVVTTVVGSANVPRPAAAKRMMKYKKARCASEIEQQVKKQMPDADQSARTQEAAKRCSALAERGLTIEQWNLDDIEADLTWCGLAGSPTKVHRIQSIVLAGGEYKQFEPNEASVTELVHELIADHTIG